jgi:hypothetical protein
MLELEKLMIGSYRIVSFNIREHISTPVENRVTYDR